LAQRPVGKASIKVEVDGIDQAKQKLDDVKSSAEGVGDSGRRGFGKLDGALGKVGKKIEDSTAGLRRFQGAITGIIGVVGGLATVAIAGFKKISDEIRKSREAAEAFDSSLRNIGTAGRNALRSIEGFGETKGELEQLEEQIRRERDLITETTDRAIEDAKKKYEEANKFNIFGEKRSREQLEKDVADAQEKGRRAKKRLNELAEKKRAEVAEKIAEESARTQEQKEQELADRVRALRLETLDDVARAEEELAFRQKQIQNEIAEAGGDERRVAQLREILALETQIGQAKVDAAKKLRDEESKPVADNEAQELAKALDDQVKAMNENTRTQQQMLQQLVIFLPDIRRVGDGVAGN